MRSITASLKRDDTDGVELAVQVKADDFAGSGSAWFSLEGLRKSLAAFEAYPIKADEIPTISGGEWSGAADSLIREDVHISVRPLGVLGQLVMSVKAFKPIHDYEFRGIGSGVSVDLFIDYEELNTFVRGMYTLVAGTSPILVFEIASTPSGRIG
jgi:hypothetical protein